MSMFALVRGAAHILDMTLGAWGQKAGWVFCISFLGSLPGNTLPRGLGFTLLLHTITWGKRSRQKLITGGLSAFSSSHKEARGQRKGWRTLVLQRGPF